MENYLWPDTESLWKVSKRLIGAPNALAETVADLVGRRLTVELDPCQVIGQVHQSALCLVHAFELALKADSGLQPELQHREQATKRKLELQEVTLVAIFVPKLSVELTQDTL